MSNELERELALYDEFERNRRSQETQQLLEFSRRNTLAAWALMTKKQRVLSYRAIVEKGKEVWSSKVVEAVYCSCMQEMERLRTEKSDEAYAVDLVSEINFLDFVGSIDIFPDM